MAGQRDPDRYGVMCYVPIELAAKDGGFEGQVRQDKLG